jgi:hypothetical protein
MKQITNKTIIKQGDKLYYSVETKDCILWYGKEQMLPVAQSQPRIEGIPVVSLDKSIDDFIYEYQQEGMLPSMAKRRILTLSNPNQYTQKDIDKAIDLAKKSAYVDAIDWDRHVVSFEETKEEILQQINSISVIEVDEQFNIISYE